jgi:tetratricopeptide (TPR) repeat protein
MSSPGAVQALNAVQSQQAQQAMRLLQSGQADGALALARALAQAAPRSPDAQQLLAMCLADAGSDAEAGAAFERALALAQGHPLVRLNHATWLRKTGRRDEALAAFRAVAAAMPDNAKAWIELGHTALDARLHAEARAALEKGVRLQPGSVVGWHALGSAHRALGDLDAAAQAFQRAVELAPRMPSTWINLGSVQRQAGRCTAAVATFEQGRRQVPASPELDDSLAGALLDQGRVEDAIAQARAVVARYPDFVPGHVSLAKMLWEYGARGAPADDAVAVFQAAVRARPDDRHLRLALARFLLSAQQAEQALAEVRALRPTWPRPELAVLEANALEVLGRSAEAGVLYAQLHGKWGASEPAFLNAYARHLMTAGHWDLAAARLEDATRVAPLNQEAWANLGTAWRLLGDPREAWLCDYERFVADLEVEPPAGMDAATFLADLRAALEPLHQAGHEPLQQSLRSGSQTPGFLFGRVEPAIVAAREAFRRAVEGWIAGLPDDPSHPFLARKAPSVRFSGSWSVRLWSSGKHVNHIHPEGWMSSAFYVALPPSIGTPQADGGQAGYIQFGQPPDELGLGLPPRRVVQPRPGRLALFPSYFWHGTVPFEDDAPRMTVAFDMQPVGRTAT